MSVQIHGEHAPVSQLVTRIRGGSGLGDSLYLRPIAEHLVRAGRRMTVMSNFPDVFIDSGCAVEPFRRERIDMVAHYVGGKNNPETTIWDDLCAHARVSAPLRFEWAVRNRRLIRGLQEQAAGRPIIIVHGGREPMGRRDKFGIELLPNEAAFGAVISALEDVLTVRIGRGDEIYRVRADADLSNRTSVSDVLDLAWSCSGIVSMCGFPIPLAEAFDKPALFVWAARGLVSANPFIRTVTPEKMLTKASSRVLIDDRPVDELREGARAFRDVL